MVMFRHRLRPHLSGIAGVGGGKADVTVYQGDVKVNEQSSDFWSASAGVRFARAPRPFVPFAQVEGAYSRTQTNGCRAALDTTSFAASGGVEYFIADRVSIEGQAGIATFFGNPQCGSGGGQTIRADASSSATFRSAISVSFHF